MPPVRRDALERCFEVKLQGYVFKRREHVHYRFRIGRQTVASTMLSPPAKYRDYGDSILSRIASQLRIPLGLLKRSASCDDKATSDILNRWRTLL
jgi:hypothetical protein